MAKPRTIDLHGYTVPEAIAQFIDFYNQCVRSGHIGPIEVIHGYGSSGRGGVIKVALHEYLEANAHCIRGFVPVSGNPGATRVHPKRPLPDDAPDTRHFRY